MNNKPKILVVDDKSENLVAIERVLNNLDVELVKVTSGNEALRSTLYHEFSLALLDVQMPDMDGYELAGILRGEEKTQNLPFIFISAVYTDTLNIFKGYEKGAFSFITKPFQAEILVNKVKFFIEKHQQEIELHRKNHELKSINEELESFSYSISHDLRAPLRALNSYSQILEEDFYPQLNDEGKRVIQKIKDNAIKMGRLIDDLLAFSKLGRKALFKTYVDMEPMVQHVLKELEQASPHPHTYIEQLPLLPSFADPGLIQQVWLNLIANAIKYSARKENPRVEIGSKDGGDHVVYYVKDNGAGFNMKYVDKLFGVFQRLHSASQFEGTGIGLAIVQRLVHKHGGRVWCDAEEDKGATFYFTLLKTDTQL